MKISHMFKFLRPIFFLLSSPFVHGFGLASYQVLVFSKSNHPLLVLQFKTSNTVRHHLLKFPRPITSSYSAIRLSFYLFLCKLSSVYFASRITSMKLLSQNTGGQPLQTFKDQWLSLIVRFIFPQYCSSASCQVSAFCKSNSLSLKLPPGDMSCLTL